MSSKQKIEGRQVSMYPEDWATVEALSKEIGLNNTSGALRLIINDWRKRRNGNVAQPIEMQAQPC